MITRRQFIKRAALGTTALTMFPAFAADNYPSKDIRMICPWAPGGGTDAISRKLSGIASEMLGTKHTIYVDNIEGGASATGILQVMRAKPDAYTWGILTFDSIITVPYQNLLAGYDLKKLKFVANVTAEPDAIIVNSKGPYKTIEDLISAAKAKPGTIKLGSHDPGSGSHLSTLDFQKATGTQFHIIYYRGGSGPLKEAVLSNEVDAVNASLGDLASLLSDGSGRGLVEFASSQNKTYTDVPSAKSKGIDVVGGSFAAIATTAGSPAERVDKMTAIWKAAAESAEFQDWLKKVGVSLEWIGPNDVDEYVQAKQTNIFGALDQLKKEGILS